MSWWRRPWGSLGRSRAGAQAEGNANDTSDGTADRQGPDTSRATADRDHPDLQALRAPGDLGERVAALRRLSGSLLERAALDEISRASVEGHVPDALLVTAADVLVQRGELDAAAELLRDVALPAGVLLAADIHAERGDHARALVLAERVLAHDIDSPGARERHERWAKTLGARRTAVQANEATQLRAPVSPTDLRIVGEAGRGGAGTVYEAHDEALGRRVALKLYHRPVEDRNKLIREARTAVELAGPGVVRVFDADPAQGRIVMEWVAGGALKDWLKRPHIEGLARFPAWYPRLTAVVAAVHDGGWVHADLKPANVLFYDLETPVISDFGLASAAGRIEAGGSLGYLSPERVAGQPLVPSDDVYALGRILEDVLDVLGAAAVRPPSPAWRRVARIATAAAGDRPALAAQLLAECPSQ